MARFSYQAQDSKGLAVSGSLEAQDRQAAMMSLAENYPLVTELVENRPPRSLLSYFGKGVSTEQLLGLFQQLAVATAAGVPLKQSLDRMGEDSETPQLQSVLFELSNSLTQGASFSDAMLQHPEAFQKYQCKLVKAGEASGKLPETLRRLAVDMESRELLTNQVRSAIAYPAFILGVAVLMSSGLLAFGVPQVKGVYDSMNAQLPLPTQILVQLGAALSTYWYLFLFGLPFGLYALKKLASLPRLRQALEDLLLTTYPFGKVFRYLNVSFFARTLGLLYGSGLPLTQGLEIVSEAVTSARMQAVVNKIKERVVNGERLSTAMRGTGYFPSLAVEMVSTGEASGNLERMLDELDRFYTRRCELAIKSLTSLIEPVITVLVGILLGGIIIGLGLPFLNLPALMM